MRFEIHTRNAFALSKSESEFSIYEKVYFDNNLESVKSGTH